MRETNAMDEWYRDGAYADLRSASSGNVYRIFYRLLGAGPLLTLLHGFPAASWDWRHLAQTELLQKHRLLAFDYPGYGYSQKPRHHQFHVSEFADICESLWAHLGISETDLVGHDVGTGTAQELLARQDEGRTAVRVNKTILMNGAIISDHYQARPIQKLLLNPLTGPCISFLLNRKMFGRSFSSSFGPDYQPSKEDVDGYWQLMSRDGGARSFHRLLHYIPDRAREKIRWERALETHQSDLCCLWGTADPFTGEYIAQDIERRLPQARLERLPGVGHFPHCEVPERVAAAIAQFLQRPDAGR